eukprot:scaffold4726_cov115-Skeletonema_dohrnii-CCMP3373.AAC.2
MQPGRSQWTILDRGPRRGERDHVVVHSRSLPAFPQLQLQKQVPYEPIPTHVDWPSHAQRSFSAALFEMAILGAQLSCGSDGAGKQAVPHVDYICNLPPTIVAATVFVKDWITLMAFSE